METTAMRTVWKFPLTITSDPQVVEVPAGAVLRLVGSQRSDLPIPGHLALWFEVHSEAPTVERTFFVCGTGWEIPPALAWRGSTTDGPYVWHVYEQVL